jgi:membrane-bound lytic murein transglycosylase B
MGRLSQPISCAAVVLAIAAGMPSVAARAPEAPRNQTPQEPAPAPTFEAFLAAVRAEGLERGLSEATLDLALTGLTPEPVVVSRDRSQPELVQSLDAYLAQRLSRRTIATARERAAAHRTLLREVEREYGVPSEIMLAIWGLESNFGRFTGTYPIIRSLATLAWDNRRALFRSELFHALTMVDKGLVTPEVMKGSWAGAMGQPQFMPSSFLRHAVDFDRNGRIDIWASAADVFGSMANYLKNAGWQPGERWGREVSVSRAVMSRVDREVPMRSSGCRAIREMTTARPLNEWQELGVRLPNGQRLPRAEMEGSLVRGRQRHFLVYRNYEAILDYNCSNSYAIAAGLLADRIGR